MYKGRKTQNVRYPGDAVHPSMSNPVVRGPTGRALVLAVPCDRRTAGWVRDHPTILSWPLVLSSLARRIFPIPPAPALFDQQVIDVGAIRQEHIPKGAPVLVVAADKLVGREPR
jgi:hypothetical protein